MSSLPVLIPARNEAAVIKRTLNSLPHQVEPIVVANDCTDNTVEIAEKFGATVIEQEKGGKLLALQSGLKHLGERALEPVLVLDADSRPISKRWHKTMERATQRQPAVPRLVGGLVCFTSGIDALSGLVYSFKPVIDAKRNGDSHIRGANLAMRITSQQLLDRILDLPNYWPGEEPALVESFRDYDGQIALTTNPMAMVATDGSRLTSLSTRITRGGQYTHNHFVDSYQQDAAAGTVAYAAQAVDLTN